MISGKSYLIGMKWQIDKKYIIDYCARKKIEMEYLLEMLYIMLQGESGVFEIQTFTSHS